MNAATDLCLKVADESTAVSTAEPQKSPAERPIANWQAGLLEYMALIPIAALLGFIESVRQTSPCTGCGNQSMLGKPLEVLYRVHMEPFALLKLSG